MLVCPQCQFENPDSNNFCQKCGTSLTYEVCPECGTQVTFDAEQCPSCGAVTGISWWAIATGPSLWQQELGAEAVSTGERTLPTSGAVGASVDSGASTIPVAASDPVTTVVDPSSTLLEAENAAGVEDFQENIGIPLESSFPSLNPKNDNKAVVEPGGSTPPQEDVAEDTTTPATWSGQYLNGQQRYQLLTDPKFVSAAEVEVRVLDRQPLQLTLLETLLEQQNLDILGADSSIAQSMGIPAVAQPYLVLQSQVGAVLPKVHDSWQQGEQQFILLEDRSKFPRLLQLWQDEQILPFQVIHWLHEMTELWAALEPWHCRQSLLELDNLRVDEDQILCLQRLYLEKAENPPILQHLGQVWQVLFHQSQRTQFAPIALLCRDLEAGDISTIDVLRSRLEAIADELQAGLPPIVMTPEFSDSDLSFPATEGADTVTSPSAQPLAGSTTSDTVDTGADMSISTAPTQIELDQDEVPTSEGDDTPTVVLPMRLIALDDAGRTDIGRQRDHNEDSFSIQTELKKLESPSGRSLYARGLYILCDGMGGHAGGEVASALAVDTLKRYFEVNWKDQLPEEATIREAVCLANKAIYDVNQQQARSGSGRMGTTLVMVLVHHTEAVVAHVGDSRLYRFSRRQGLEQITVDHEVGQREIQRGVEPAIAYARPDAYQLTQALGPRDENFMNPSIEFFELNEDSLLILCSDGLTDNDLLETHWRTHLEPLLSAQANLEQGVSQLIDLANQYNGHDNITAVVVRTRVRPNLEQLR